MATQILIKNADISYGQKEKYADLLITSDRIREIYKSNSKLVVEAAEIIDAKGLTAIPGLIDIHIHGCAGHDFCEGTQEALEAMANYELSQGITAFCPTSMTLSEEQLAKVFANAALFKERQDKGETGGAKLIGINMEGPFVSPQKLGAQNPKYQCNPDIAMFRRLQKAAKGLIKFITIAPELPGAIEFIEELHNEVNISIGHTNAEYETALLAMSKGAKHITHMYNAMTALNHRSPGVAGAVLQHHNVCTELICDGIHLHPAVVNFTYNNILSANDNNSLPIFISDSMEATGLKDGSYTLGGQAVIKVGNKATLTDMETIAGSVTNLMDCLRWSVKNAGLSLKQAASACSCYPASQLGISEKGYGRISQNAIADLLLVDEKLNLKCIVQNGKIVCKHNI